MKTALIAAIVAAVVASGTAMAASWQSGKTAAPHRAPAPASRPAHVDPVPHPAKPRASSHRALRPAAIAGMVAAWSAAHPGWKNPADMTHQQLLQAVIAHPEVYAPGLDTSSKALRTIQQYGGYATMSPQLRALERAQGIPIPANLPHVSLSKLPLRRTG